MKSTPKSHFFLNQIAKKLLSLRIYPIVKVEEKRALPYVPDRNAKWHNPSGRGTGNVSWI